MDKRILALSFAGFATGTEAYVYAGHLATLAAELDADLAIAGQLASAFALTYALTAPFVAGAVAHLPRRAVIAAGLGLIGVLNLLAAAMPSLEGLFVIRVLCGLAAGLAGPISSVAAAELAGPEHRGRAMAAVLGGTTVAFVAGIPMGSAVGEWFGWRSTFAYSGLLALVAAAVVVLVLPRMPGGKRAGAALLAAAGRPEVLRWLLLTLLGFAATFSVVAYIGPVMTETAGLTGSGVGAMQALIGVGSIAGIALGARRADAPGGERYLVATFLLSAVAMAAHTFLLVGQFPFNAAIPALVVVTFLGAAALFARIPVIQARLVSAVSADERPVVLALNGSMVFAGQGLGALVGGVAIGTAGLPGVGLAGAVVAAFGAGLVWWGAREDFTRNAYLRASLKGESSPEGGQPG